MRWEWIYATNLKLPWTSEHNMVDSMWSNLRYGQYMWEERKVKDHTTNKVNSGQ
jgi:hypothetical protein